MLRSDESSKPILHIWDDLGNLVPLSLQEFVDYWINNGYGNDECVEGRISFKGFDIGFDTGIVDQYTIRFVNDEVTQMIHYFKWVRYLTHSRYHKSISK